MSDSLVDGRTNPKLDHASDLRERAAALLTAADYLKRARRVSTKELRLEFELALRNRAGELELRADRLERRQVWDQVLRRVRSLDAGSP